MTLDPHKECDVINCSVKPLFTDQYFNYVFILRHFPAFLFLQIREENFLNTAVSCLPVGVDVKFGKQAPIFVVTVFRT